MLIKCDAVFVQGVCEIRFCADVYVEKCAFPIKITGCPRYKNLKTTQSYNLRRKKVNIGLPNALRFYRARPGFIERAQVLSSALVFHRTLSGFTERAQVDSSGLEVAPKMVQKWPKKGPKIAQK